MSDTNFPPDAPRDDRDAETARRVRQAALAAMAEFAAGAGHEINNPLATIIGRAQLLLKTETDPQRRQALLTIGGQAYRIRDMIGDAMLFARPPHPDPRPLDLADELRTILSRLEEQAAERDCAIALDAPEPVPILADRTQLAVVVSELVRNGVEALAAVEERAGGTTLTGGARPPVRTGRRVLRPADRNTMNPATVVADRPSVRVAARAIRVEDRPFAVLTVADDGVGLSEEEHAHLFDPFYSGRQAGRGLGFGLAKAWRIVTQHGGTIDVGSASGEETRFEVRWPADRIAPPRPGLEPAT